MILWFVTQDTEMEMLTKVLRVNVLSWWLVYLVGSKTGSSGWIYNKRKRGRKWRRELKRGKCHHIRELFQYTIKIQQAGILNAAASG